MATSGQSFKIGQAATVPFTSGNKSGQLALTVTSIEAGNPADLASLNVADKVKGKTPSTSTTRPRTPARRTCPSPPWAT